MKASLFVFLFVSSLCAAAPVAVPSAPPAVHVGQPVSFDLVGVPVVQFAQTIYKDSLGRDYVVASDLVDSQKKVSISVKGLPLDHLAGFVDQILRTQGVSSTLRDGVYYLEVAKDLAPAAGSPTASGSAAGPSGLDDVDVGEPVSGNVAGSAAGSREPGRAVKPEKFFVMRAENRPVDFLVSTLNAVFGQNVAKAASGPLLVVSVSEAREKAVRDVLAQIDVASKSVEVLASFVEVTRGVNEARGLSLVSAAVSRKLGVGFDTMQGQATVQAGSYQLVMDALAGDSRFKQVSNWRVVGDDGEKLLLQVGDDTPTLSSSSKDNQGNPIQNVTYRPSGVILDVLPKVMGSGRLSLVLDGQVSAFQATVTGVAGSPTLVKREVKTSVSVDDGQVLVVGGLEDAKTTSASGGFSFLPASWRASTNNDQKTDLVLILSAKVLQGL